MTDEVFTEPEESDEEWVDVRMTEPERGEWDVDVVVAEGRVEYLDLRVRPELLAGFVDCLIEDVGKKRAASVLQRVAADRGVDVEAVDDDHDGPEE